MMMVHKNDIIPGLSKFIDRTVLSQYPPNSIKRIVGAGAIALFLNKNTSIVDSIIQNPLFSNLDISTADGMIDIDTLRSVFKSEIAKVGYMRVHFPMLGDVDFTPDDIDALYESIRTINSSGPLPAQVALQ